MQIGWKFDVLGAGYPLEVNFKAPNPEKTRIQNRTRRLSY